MSQRLATIAIFSMFLLANEAIGADDSLTPNMNDLSCSGAPGSCGPAALSACLGQVRARTETLALASTQGTAAAFHRRGWINSGAWLSNDQLLLVDPTQQGLLSYTLSSRSLQHRLGQVDLLKIVSAPDGAWVQTRSGLQLLQLDRRLRFGRTTAIESLVPGLSSVYSWSIGHAASFLLGDFQGADGNWKTGLFRVRDSGSSLLYALDLSDPYRSYYLVGSSYVAIAAGKGYFLRMAEKPVLYEIGPTGTMSTTGLIAKGNTVPVLGLSELTAAAKTYAAVERGSMPVAVYGQGDNLYVLYRAPAALRTRWSLMTIDAKQDRILGEIKLPTAAHHLVVVPGEKHWALVEKGEVLGLGEQDITGLIVLKTSDLRPRSNLDSAAEEVNAGSRVPISRRR